jgi:2-polyprenyl-6-methoxyphenol hydroxylase-like FAD-dependent oxidoreductase
MSSHVAIIGAGLSGLALALALHQQNIKSTIYESRPAPLNIGGAVMLSPNALKVLNALGVYERVRTKGYNFETVEYRHVSGKLMEVQEFGSEEKYGYNGLRIYRYVLIDELVAMLRERNIPIEFGKKFSKIVSETEEQVTWEFTDGEQCSASLLVGADGIHSTVRRYLYPDLTPKFTGMAGITAAVPTAQLKLPAGYHIPVTVMSEKGAFVIAPQQADGSEVLIGKQLRLEDRDRAGWDNYLADKAALVEFLSTNNEAFPEFVKNAVSNIPHDKINVWPFYIVPKLDKWTSNNRRVIILGDAAHAIPPSAGQGINQAFEDVYIFALLMGKGSKVNVQDSLKFWQEYRQDRIEKIMVLNHQIDLRRMPTKEGEGKKEPLELRWVYEPVFEKDVEEWVAKQG